MGSQIVRKADVAMYDAAPDEGLKVTLLNMTPNPLRAIATAAAMYDGVVIRDVNYISRSKAEECLASMMRTGTKAPLEYVNFHFFIEGVTRAWTHQQVRQRTATYVQESMRFAVKTNGEHEVMMPPSIAALKEDAPARILWENAVYVVTTTYKNLIASGIPAEDARGLLPTNITTKMHYTTNLRNLIDHAGMRLCSQAQFEWKQVWVLILKAIREYPLRTRWADPEQWQYDAIANLFKPVCYHTNKCEFMGASDRFCTIRERVEAHHEAGEKSDTWDDINPLEPLMEGAARLRPGAK